MILWEYETKELVGWHDLSVVHDLNRLGEQGWELCVRIPPEIGKETLWIFKRRILKRGKQATKGHK